MQSSQSRCLPAVWDGWARGIRHLDRYAVKVPPPDSDLRQVLRKLAGLPSTTSFSSTRLAIWLVLQIEPAVRVAIVEAHAVGVPIQDIARRAHVSPTLVRLLLNGPGVQPRPAWMERDALSLWLAGAQRAVVAKRLGCPIDRLRDRASQLGWPSRWTARHVMAATGWSSAAVQVKARNGTLPLHHVDSSIRWWWRHEIEQFLAGGLADGSLVRCSCGAVAPPVRGHWRSGHARAQSPAAP